MHGVMRYTYMFSLPKIVGNLQGSIEVLEYRARVAALS